MVPRVKIEKFAPTRLLVVYVNYEHEGGHTRNYTHLRLHPSNITQRSYEYIGTGLRKLQTSIYNFLIRAYQTTRESTVYIWLHRLDCLPLHVNKWTRLRQNDPRYDYVVHFPHNLELMSYNYSHVRDWPTIITT